jgi:hypothetical protein
MKYRFARPAFPNPLALVNPLAPAMATRTIWWILRDKETGEAIMGCPREARTVNPEAMERAAFAMASGRSAEKMVWQEEEVEVNP